MSEVLIYPYIEYLIDPMPDPLVSVVVPTYYRNDQLQQAIRSVREQEYENIECIIVDGSESDRHAEPVAEELGVQYNCPSTDEGAHAARSVGAIDANGDYINFLDDDDRFAPSKLKKQVAIAESEAEVGVVYCGIRWDDGHVVLPDQEVRGNVLEYALMFQMTPSSPSTMLIDTEVANELLPFVNLHGADDMGMKIELARRCEFEFIDEPLVLKGDSEESLGGSRENIEGRLELLERYDNLYARYPDRVRRTALAHTHLLDAELTLNERIWSPQALKQAVLACRRVPGWPISFVGYLMASILGRPGRDFANIVYLRLVLGDQHRGKLT